MAEENNIKSFTAADIERYHQGLLTSQEKHALEKAALDDPFLADAMEGYTTPGVNIQTDIPELKERLAERTTETKVVPIDTGRRTFSPFLRAAAMIIVLVGAGLLVYQFALNKSKQTGIAQNKPDNNQPATEFSDTGKTDTGRSTEVGRETNKAVSQVVSEPASKPAQPVSSKDNNNDLASNADESVVTANPQPESRGEKISQPVNKPLDGKTAPAGGAPVATTTAKEGDIKGFRDDAGRSATSEMAKAKAPAAKKQEPATERTRGLGIEDEESVQKEVVANAQGAYDDKNSYRRQSMNTFRGRVTDEDNTGLPFANVTNIKDNVGTYTDANGNFTLTSSDSVLNVQVRSLGYDDNNARLRKNISTNNVVMQEDRSVSQVVIDNRKPNAALRRSLTDSSIRLTEPEPLDGWVKYDNYLANNLNIPDDFKYTKTTAVNSVEVSFEVDKNGDPVNIRVEKSLCTACDKEAIRLIKEGPKWRRNARKKGRTTVTINF